MRDESQPLINFNALIKGKSTSELKKQKLKGQTVLN